jgi:uncharacterized protein (DUF2062 family)/SAM-dependent methyltransferase
VKYEKQIRDLLYHLRTEGGSPGRVAAAVGIGVFIGCSPYLGLHLFLCLLVARLLGLNRMLTYLASHISLPGVWPLLILAEVQLARRLRGARLLTVHSFHPNEMWHLAWWKQFGGDAVVGSLLVGAVLAVAFAVPTYRIALRRSRQPEISTLIEETAFRYLDTGLFNCEFVRGKLRHDPVYFHLLRRGALPTDSRLLDLGCGRGILFSLLLTARAQAERGTYPAGWTPPPHLSFFGIEGREKTAEVARQALGVRAHIETADLTTAALPTADIVLLLDVLHYLPLAAQEDLLARIAAALSPGGLLLIRDADADAGWRFTATRCQERLSALARRRWRQRFYYRGRREWSAILEKLGFEVIDQPMGEGTPYANVLITARR